MKVSIKDISKRTGFSPATISNALNHKRGVNEETAAEVFRVAKEIGYISESKIMRVKLVIFKNNGKIIKDGKIIKKALINLRKEERVRKIIHTGWDNAICEYFDIEENRK